MLCVFCTFLSYPVYRPLLSSGKIGGEGGLYTGHAFASCQRKRDFCHQMPNDNQVQNDIRTLDSAGMNVHVDFNFF